MSILFPRVCYRVMEMPYAYQCCVYGSCDSYKPAGQWDTEQSNTDEDLHKRTVAMYPIHTDTHCKRAHTYNNRCGTYIQTETHLAHIPGTTGKVINRNPSTTCVGLLPNYWHKPAWNVSEACWNHSKLAADALLQTGVLTLPRVPVAGVKCKHQ